MNIDLCYIWFMKKVLMIAVVVLGTSIVQAQDKKTGIVAGYTNMKITIKESYQGGSNSEDEDVTGFFIGLTRDVDLNNKLSFQPGVVFTRVSENDESDNFFQIPLMLKYQAFDNFSLLAGPKMDYLLGLEEEEKEIINEFIFSLAVGLEVKIVNNLALIANYSFQINDALNDDFVSFVDSEGFEISGKYNVLNFGLAYKF